MYFVIAKDLVHSLIGPFTDYDEARLHVRACEQLLPTSSTEYTIKPGHHINIEFENIHHLSTPQHNLEVMARVAQFEAHLEANRR